VAAAWNVTVQLAVPAVVPAVRLQGLPATVPEAVPVNVAVNVTVPVGVVGLALVSVTVPLQVVEALLATVDGVQETVVVVAARDPTVMVILRVRSWLGLPLAPLTVSVIVPEAVDGTFTVIVDVPEPDEPIETLVGENVAVDPVGEKVAESATLPVNPPCPVTVIVACPLPPAGIVRLGGVEESTKFVTVTVIDTAEPRNVLPVVGGLVVSADPTTRTTNVPVGVVPEVVPIVTVATELPSVTTGTLSVAVRPGVVANSVPRSTHGTPPQVKPLPTFTEILLVPEFPSITVMEAGLSDIVKNGTVPAPPVAYVAVSIFSATAAAEPFSIITQFGGLLVGFCAVPQPVWKFIGMVPVVTSPTMSKMAVKSRPEVGATVRPLPPWTPVASSMVPIPAVLGHEPPTFGRPLIHFRRI